MPIILDQELYDEVKEDADAKYKKHSAYKSMWIQKEYKNRGGKFKDDGKERELTRWKKEQWRDVGGLDYPVYRPTKKINKKTPLTPDEIDTLNLLEQIFLKQILRGEFNLPKFKK